MTMSVHSCDPGESDEISGTPVPPPGYLCLYVALRMRLLSVQTKHALCSQACK